MWLGLVALVVWTLFKATAGSQGYELEPFQASPGAYFEDLGHATLSTTTWTILTYVPLRATMSEAINLEKYIDYIDKTCSRLIVKNWTACSHFGDMANRRLQEIKNLQRLLVSTVQRGEENGRFRRGLFNFVGKVSKTLFGTMDDDDAQFYHEQIERFEQGTTTLTQLARQQLVIVKSTLGIFNETLTDLEYNERKTRDGLSQLQSYVTTFGSQIENATYLLSLKIATEDHIAKALDASQAILRTLDILISNIADAQKGTLSPRVVTPALLLDALRDSSPSFPPDTTLPFPLGKDHIHALCQLCDVHVYIFKERLGYLILVPLVHKRTFDVLRVIPLPVRVNQNNFVYIDVGDSVLCIDRAKQYYFTMTDNELAQCKTLEAEQYVCKLQRTLFSTVTVESCAVTMFQKRETLPVECDTRLVSLSHTVWTQLRNNTWIYFAPILDTITVLCNNRNPVDVGLKGVGRLQVYSGCKGYGTTAILYGNSNAGNVSKQLRGDLISQVPLLYNCCEDPGFQVNLSRLSVDLRYRKSVTHLGDMKHASERVSELLEKVREQEWKNTHAVYHNAHSILLFFVVTIVLICLLYKLYPCVRHWDVLRSCKKQVSIPSTDTLGVVERGQRGSVINVKVGSNNDCLGAEDATPQLPERTPCSMVPKSRF